MIPYITYREPVGDEMGYFILQKEYPHYLGRIVEFPTGKKITYASVGQYNLYVEYYGTIMGNFVPIFDGVILEMQLALEKMADWFLENRILTEPKKYKKFKK